MNASLRTRRLTHHTVATGLPPRPLDCHKGQFGSTVIIGGSNGMVGAALLAGRAALHLGAGVVHVGLLADNAPGVDIVQPELMLHPAQHCAGLPASVIALGCGLGQSAAAHTLLRDALQYDTPLVLDADALNLLATHEELRALLLARPAPTILTPHPGEAARLLGCTPAKIQADRLLAVQRLAASYRCELVLKGANSLCVTHNGEIFRNETGHPGMSAPGMGDVLTGMIAAFIAQRVPTDVALLLAVHLHGAAGEALAAQGSAVGMTASEVILAARQQLNLMRV